MKQNNTASVLLGDGTEHFDNSIRYCPVVGEDIYGSDCYVVKDVVFGFAVPEMLTVTIQHSPVTAKRLCKECCGR